MNKIIISGRLTRDPELRVANNEKQTHIVNFSVAVDKKTRDGGANFIPVVVMGDRADWAIKYLHKGSRVEVAGSLETGSYEKNGVKYSTFNILANEVEFGETKAEADARGGAINSDEFVNVAAGIEEELPFS